MSRLYFISLVLSVLYLAGCQAGDDNRIQPYEQNPAYWQYRGRPVDIYAVFFPDGGEVVLDVSDIADGRQLRLQWLDIMPSGWRAPQTLQAGTTLDLQAPGGSFQAVLVRPL